MNNLYAKLKIFLALWEGISNETSDFPNGKYSANLEKKLADFIRIKHVITVSSGTDALILSLKALDIGPGDEVIVPTIGFFSTAGAVSWVNAKPVFVDVEEESMNIDPARVEQALTPRTRAIIPVHLNGRMADMNALAKVAGRRSLRIIEDATHALGSLYGESPPGHLGDMACLSFNPTKIFGGYDNGGAILTNDDLAAEKLFWLRRYGSRFMELGIDHPVVGITSILSRLQTVSLEINIGALDSILKKTRENYFLYAKLLQGVGDLRLPLNPPKEYVLNGYRFMVYTSRRDQLRRFLRDRGIDARIQYGVPLPYFGAFKYLGHKRGEFPVAEKIASACLALPTQHSLSASKITEIASRVEQFFAL